MLETILLLAFSVLLGLGFLGFVGWLAINHDVATFDGLFLFLTCLVLSLVFFLNAYWTLKSEEFRQMLEKKEPKSEEGAKSKISAPTANS